MSIKWRQVAALLTIFKYKYLRDLTTPIKDYLFPIAIALAIIFLSKIEGGANLLAIYLPWGYCGYVRQVFVDVAMDKANKNREYFKINGLSRGSYYTAYVIDGVLKSSITSLILLSGFVFSNIEQFRGWNLLSVFLVLEMNAVSMTFISYTLGVFLEDPFVGSDIIGTVYGLMGFFYFIGISAPSSQFFCALFPPAAMTMSTLGQTYNITFKTWHGVFMLLGDVLLYFIIFFICDTFFGVDKEFTSAYWCRILSRSRRVEPFECESAISLEQSLLENETTGNEMPLKADIFDKSSATHHEPINSRNLIRTVQIENLRKNYGDVEIIRGMSVSIYERQIFCLLGHNGAGKTTTISMLTGFSRPDDGIIKYFGKDFKKQFDEIKDKIGVCPQTDLCFPFMTCEENLKLLAEIRGIPRDTAQNEIDEHLDKVGLLQDKKKLSSQLSGGNRRKLSLAMAMMGGTRILYFDEPTSAMDPSSRRVIWNIIKDLRNQGKTIILTTHYLEEADELADRIGVMSKGNLFAVGSTEYIKKEFGVGYHLYISTKYGHEIAKQFNSLKSKLIEIVQEAIPEATLVQYSSSQVLKFCLPFSSQSKFAALFKTLETEDGLQLNLEMNSLEDAFLNISIEEGKKDKHNTTVNIEDAPESVNKPATYNFWDQMSACFYRRYLMTIRSPQGYYAILQPIAFIVTATVLPQSIQNPSQSLASFVAFLCIGFTANSSIYCGSIVYDREKKIKYALRVMGCKNSAYWLGTFLFDFMLILCFVAFLLVLVYIQQLEIAITHIWTFLALALTFVSANVTVAYFWGFAYDSSVDATSFHPVLALLCLYLIPFATQAILSWAKYDSGALAVQIFGFIIGPCLAFQQGIFALNPIQGKTDYFNHILIAYPWIYVLILLVQTIGYMLITVVIENRKTSVKIRNKSTRNRMDSYEEDDSNEFEENVEQEVNQMMEGESSHVIKVKNLEKVYPTGQRAVKGISFGVEKGEIFGLLGPNGAGKSTTFNIITQLIDRSGGEVELGGRSIDSEDQFSIYKDCGVCPQFDSLWELLTVKEHLIIFGKVKGLRGKELRENVEYFLDVLHIRQHKNKKTSQLSGGNKRRLCVAMASIGAPTMQFMDEPSTGLDPLARVYLWDTIKQTLALRNSSIILTTHSMPEAEALCSKIGIMVNGRFVCLGNTAYLKNKYGSGYKVTLSKGPELKCSMVDIIKEISPDAQFLEQDESDIYETYQVPGKNFVFSKAFETLEHFKQKKWLSDFSIYHTTLENVFLEFSRYQKQEPVAGMKKSRPRRKSSLQEKAQWEKENSRKATQVHLQEFAIENSRTSLRETL